MNANQKLQRFLPYHTNKDHSTFFGDFLVSVGRSFGYIPCLFGREEIIVILCLHFSKLFAKNWFGPYKNKKLCSSLAFPFVMHKRQTNQVVE